MQISDNLRITDVQNEFNTRFPGLKIAFYSAAHNAHEGSAKSKEIDPNQTLGNITEGFKDGDISLNAQKTIAQLESEFESRFGLHVQVFRRSNTLWLQTSATDDWTLDVQNTKGLHSLQKSS